MNAVTYHENWTTYINETYMNSVTNNKNDTMLTYSLKLNFLPESGIFPIHIFIIISNFLVIISSGLILKSKVQPWTTHMFLGNLALADLLHGVGCIGVTKLMPQIKSASYLCLLLMGLGSCYALECSLNVCLIAVDRYIYIRHGLHYTRWMTTRRVRYILAATWVFSLVTGLVIELLFGDYSYNGCTYFGVTPFFGLILIGVMGLTPNIITIVLYFLIFITAFRVGKSKCEQYLRKLNNKSLFEKNNMNDLTQNNSITSIWNITDNEFVFEKDTRVKDKKDKTLDVNLHKNDDVIFLIDKTHQINFNNEESKEHNINTLRDKRGKEFESDNSIMGKNKLNSFNASDKNEEDKNSYNKIRRHKIKTKSIMIVFLIMTTFTVSWGPCFLCVTLYAILCDGLRQSDICLNLEYILSLLDSNLGLINALFNPIIYCWWHKGFRKAFLKIFCKKTIRERKRNDFVAALNE